MGLLDWLGDALGGDNGPTGGTPMVPGLGGQAPQLDPMGNSTGPAGPLPVPAPAPTNPMPPAQGAGMDAPRMYDDAAGLPQAPAPRGGAPLPLAEDPMTAGGVRPGGPGLTPPNAAPVATTPPNAAPAEGVGAPMVLDSYRRAGGTMMDPGRGDMGPPQARSFLGRALGLDPNTEKTLSGSLGAGLKAAGENSNKGKGAAFMGSAGSAIEGGDKADDKILDQQDRYLQRAIAAKREGNHAEYQKNYLAYQIAATKEKLAAAKEKAVGASVMNSPEQLYLRAVGATNQDGNLKILNNAVTEARKQFGADSPQAKAAAEAYEKRYKEVRDSHLGTLGVDPSKIKALEGKPGFSDKNPVKDFPKDPAAAQKAFDALPEGAYFINPKDGRLLMKKGGGGAQGQNPAQPQQQSLLPPMPVGAPYDQSQAVA